MKLNILPGCPVLACFWLGREPKRPNMTGGNEQQVPRLRSGRQNWEGGDGVPEGTPLPIDNSQLTTALVYAFNLCAYFSRTFDTFGATTNMQYGCAELLAK